MKGNNEEIIDSYCSFVCHCDGPEKVPEQWSREGLEK